MSLIRSALERLDTVVGKLDTSVSSVEYTLQDYVPANEMLRQVDAARQKAQLCDSEGNVIDVDFVARRLDKAIETVEHLLGK
ncbi:MAG: hypothetical protein KAJ29_02150 [Alphaproteobacteria bacterium]|nr:hypothetical protein [Alphaproteobacteria bacterium]